MNLSRIADRRLDTIKATLKFYELTTMMQEGCCQISDSRYEPEARDTNSPEGVQSISGLPELFTQDKF